MYNTVNSQFTDAMIREGKDITLLTTGTSFKCLFRRNSDKNTKQDRTTIFYSIDSPLIEGELLKFRNNIYLAINQETAENDTYYKSDLLKTNIDISVLSGDKELMLHCYAGNLQATALISNTTISMVGGNIELLTEDNQNSRLLAIDNTFTAFGGTYKIINLYYRAGIAYIYVDRTQSTAEPTYSLAINANDSYNINDTATISVNAMRDTTLISNPTIEYSVSDRSIADITTDGVITFIAEGTVTISATWIEHNVTAEKTIEVTEGVTTGTATITYSGYAQVRTNDVSKTFTAHFFDKNGTELTGITAVWNLVLSTAQQGKVTISEQTATYVRVKCSSSATALIGTTFTIELSTADGIYNASQVVTIIGVI